MKRTLRDYLVITAKGMAMGAADVVPGVSGGTIAFITGIYEELLQSINSINFGLIKTLKEEGFVAVWNKVNGNFLLALMTGIAISVLSLAKVITHLLEKEPVLIWSFFFGLIVSSVFLIGKSIKNWNISSVIGLIVGTIVAYVITTIPPSESSGQLWYLFIAGMIAICAMILPGISGSFILLLLGAYQIVLGAIKDLKLATIAVFASGCIVGLLSFSRLLEWMLKKHESTTIAILTGFLIGSLNKVWPWKQNIEARINSHDKLVPFLDKNVLPNDYSFVTEVDKLLGLINKDPQLIMSIVLAFIGFFLIFGLEKFSQKKA
jgi:putative membrane protein